MLFALAQMLGTRSPTERLAHTLLHLMNLYGVDEHHGSLDRRVVHARRSRAYDGRDAPVGHHQPQAVHRAWILAAHGSNLVIKNADMLSEIRDGKLAKAAASDEAEGVGGVAKPVSLRTATVRIRAIPRLESVFGRIA
jgi:hypothetical protein